MRNKNTKYFRVTLRNQYYRLTHVPSGDYIQRHLCDFLTRKDAIECRDRVLAAAPDWDWSDSAFFQNIPHETFHRVWDAIYNRISQ